MGYPHPTHPKETPVLSKHFGDAGAPLVLLAGCSASTTAASEPKVRSRIALPDSAPYGLAYDREGRPQACMGVAVGDANGDSRVEIFVQLGE